MNAAHDKRTSFPQPPYSTIILWTTANYFKAPSTRVADWFSIEFGGQAIESIILNQVGSKA